jgi:hypothetical protein
MCRPLPVPGVWLPFQEFIDYSRQGPQHPLHFSPPPHPFVTESTLLTHVIYLKGVSFCRKRLRCAPNKWSSVWAVTGGCR